MKTNLCACLNCGSILIDTNPQVGAEDIDLYLAIFNSLGTLTDFEEDGEIIPNGCPNCLTDGYLSDEWRNVVEWLNKDLQ